MRTRQVFCCLTGVMGGTTHEENPVWYESVQICSIAAHQRETVWFCLLSVWLYMLQMFIYIYMYTTSMRVSQHPPPSSCWWQWCRCPVLWSFAGSRGGSSCLPASPGCGQRRPACPPFGPEPKERTEEGSGTPASQPPPAPAGQAASHTPLHTHNTQKQKQLVTVEFRVIFLMSLTSNSQTEFNHWSDL